MQREINVTELPFKQLAVTIQPFYTFTILMKQIDRKARVNVCIRLVLPSDPPYFISLPQSFIQTCA